MTNAHAHQTDIMVTLELSIVEDLLDRVLGY